MSQHHHMITASLALLTALALPACTNDGNADDGASDATTGDATTNATTGDEPDCPLGELGCNCNAGQCFPPYECVADFCTDPACTPGEELCECAEGGLCLGALECIDGLCMNNSCTPNAYYRCDGNDVHWYDSCDEIGAIKEMCDPATQNCMNSSDTTAECIPKDPTKCGNGMIDLGESCDGTNFNGATCESLGFAGGNLVCADNCGIDTSNCLTCGNGVIEGNEDCDGQALGPESCQSFGYDGGELSCAPNCQYDQGACFYCDCDVGTCCDGCDFLSANVECAANADVQYGCPDGTEPGADVSQQTRSQQCSGFSAGCDGAFGPWSNWQLADNCSDDEYCQPGNSNCQSCDYSFDVTQYQCNQFSNGNANGPGGGEIIEICGSTNSQTGHMTVTARKYDGSNFGSRPYQVRVSGPNDGDCGPNAWFFDPSDSDPIGIGTNQLTFSFSSIWLPGQTEKAYCVTASTKPGDLGYDPNNPQQLSWWYSDKLTLVRNCD